MAKKVVPLTGVALLAAIAASETGYLMLTQAEGQEAVNAGNAEIDSTIPVEGDKAAVRLTEAGKLAASQAAPVAAPATGFAIDDGVAVPTGERSGSGRESKYPFAQLEIGQSFHVPATTADPNPATKLSSSVTGANLKFSKETGEMESYTVRVYKKNPDGSFLKDSEGKRVLESATPGQRSKRKQLRTFVVKAVGADDPKGVGARVWRTA